jgi:hybrid cluster-associated redox disulfide protein
VAIHRDMLILEILQQYPKTKTVFARYGMPCDRCMGAVRGSLAEGARMHGVPLETLLRELRDCVLGEQRPTEEQEPD